MNTEKIASSGVRMGENGVTRPAGTTTTKSNRRQMPGFHLPASPDWHFRFLVALGSLTFNGLWGKYFKCADFWHVLVAVHVLNCCHAPRNGPTLVSLTI